MLNNLNSVFNKYFIKKTSGQDIATKILKAIKSGYLKVHINEKNNQERVKIRNEEIIRQFLGREEELKRFFQIADLKDKYFKKIHENIKADRVHDQLRIINPYVCIASGPGGGKTRMLEQIAKILCNPREYGHLFPNEEFIKRIDEKVLPILISFNNSTSLNPDNHSDRHPIAALNMRILNSYFLNDEGFDKFARIMHSYLQELIYAETEFFIEFIYDHSRKFMGNEGTYLFLGIDELKHTNNIIKHPNYPNPVNTILNQVKNISDIFPNLFHCCTTLDIVGLVDSDDNMFSDSKSKRPIQWLKIDPFDVEASKKIIEPFKTDYKQSLKYLEDKKTKNNQLGEKFNYSDQINLMDLTIEKLTLDSLGHPRTLEFIASYLIESQKKSMFKYNQAVDDITSKTTGINIEAEVIRSTLLEKEFLLTEKIKDFTISYLIKEGIYVNSISNHQARIKPIMSNFEIFKYINHIQASNTNRIAWEENGLKIDDQTFVNALKWIKTPPDELNSSTFEDFYCNWEILFRLINANKQLSLSKEWFKIKFASRDYNQINAHIDLPTLLEEDCRVFYYEKLTSDLEAYDSVFEISNVYQCNNNQSSCDSISFFRTNQGIKIQFANMKFQAKKNSYISVKDISEFYVKLLTTIWNITKESQLNLSKLYKQKKGINYFGFVRDEFNHRIPEKYTGKIYI